MAAFFALSKILYSFSTPNQIYNSPIEGDKMLYIARDGVGNITAICDNQTTAENLQALIDDNVNRRVYLAESNKTCTDFHGGFPSFVFPALRAWHRTRACGEMLVVKMLVRVIR